MARMKSNVARTSNAVTVNEQLEANERIVCSDLRISGNGSIVYECADKGEEEFILECTIW